MCPADVDQDREAMELIEPPKPETVEGMPKKATVADAKALSEDVDKRRLWGLLPPEPSIGLAAAKFSESCVGAGFFCNNCAHFLSNAFILAGYDELTRRQRYINARCFYTDDPGCPGCDPSTRRPIRARELEKWFMFKATVTKDLSNTTGETVEERFESVRNTGFWAVFQREPGGYWGGHVCVIDTDSWNYYGTGSDGYWQWKLQHLYKW